MSTVVPTPTPAPQPAPIDGVPPPAKTVEDALQSTKWSGIITAVGVAAGYLIPIVTQIPFFASNAAAIVGVLSFFVALSRTWSQVKFPPAA